MGVKPRAITLHIEALVLAGFPPGSKHAIGDAVQSELMRLLHEGASRTPLRAAAFLWT